MVRCQVFRFWLFLWVLCIVAVGQANAADERWYLTPGVSYIVPDSDRLADDNIGYQFGIGKPYTPFLNFELTLVGDSLHQASSPFNFKQRGIVLDAIYFPRYGKIFSLTPYSVLGIGVMKTDFDREKTQSRFTGNLGVGVMHTLGSSERMALRSDIRLRVDEADLVQQNRFDDWMVNLTLVVWLGNKDSDQDSVPDHKDACPSTPFGATVNKRGCELDSDHDGVFDSNDLCPNTPLGIKVNQKGCELDSDGDGVFDSRDLCPNTPLGVKVNQKGCELDSDSDGVFDSRDLCPFTPLGTKVDADGCTVRVDGNKVIVPVDSDQDGVPDDKDACPSTPLGIRVDERGCELDSDNDGVVDSKDLCPGSKLGDKVNLSGCKVNETIVLKGVHFVTGSDHLFPYSTAILDAVAGTLHQNPETVVEIAGHTDNMSDADFNKKLSERRAQSVVNYLVSKGVPASNLKPSGYGEDRPVATNSTPAGRTKNRRVELRILN